MVAPSHSAADADLRMLQDRARLRRQRYTRKPSSSTVPQGALVSLSAIRSSSRDKLARYALHVLVALMVPLAAALGSSSFGPGLFPIQEAAPPMPVVANADFIAQLAPIPLDQSEGEQPVPESAFAAIDAMPISQLPPELLAPQPIHTAISADNANVRGGPGEAYDKIATLPAGAAITLLARADDWFKAQTNDGAIVWIAAELLNVDPTDADMLPLATNIPAPPPPKVGRVAAEGLSLRDGPGTGYIGMAKLPADTQLDLLARYEGWFHVQGPSGQLGWVSGEHLLLQPGVAERIQVVTEIPDPNPALVALISSAQVNLRGGPGTVYAKLGSLGSNTQISLLARYKDWFKVRTSGGSEGWVSNELLDVNPFVLRRVPQAGRIPAPPKTQRAARNAPAAPAAPARPGMPAQFAPASASSGPSQFALQFVGARYSWGGGSPSKGFDCSGFTQYIYAQYGMSLPHSAAGQFSTSYGTMVSNPADLRAGDIVFFANTYKQGISHVGIYVGGGDVVQALTPGRGVGVASLGGGYWASHYYGAIRPGG